MKPLSREKTIAATVCPELHSDPEFNIEYCILPYARNQLMLKILSTPLEIFMYSPHILSIIFTHYLINFQNSNFRYKMFTWRLVCLGSAYIKQKNYTSIVCTLQIRYVLFYLWTKDLNGTEPTSFKLPCMALITITLRYLEHAL